MHLLYLHTRNSMLPGLFTPNVPYESNFFCSLLSPHIHCHIPVRCPLPHRRSNSAYLILIKSKIESDLIAEEDPRDLADVPESVEGGPHQDKHISVGYHSRAPFLGAQLGDHQAHEASEKYHNSLFKSTYNRFGH